MRLANHDADGDAEAGAASAAGVDDNERHPCSVWIDKDMYEKRTNFAKKSL